MYIKVKETGNVYNIVLRGWKDNSWSCDFAADVLTDMDHHDGMELPLQEYVEYIEWLDEEVNRYNEGGNVEWYERSAEYPENDFEELMLEVQFAYTDEE